MYCANCGVRKATNSMFCTGCDNSAAESASVADGIRGAQSWFSAEGPPISNSLLQAILVTLSRCLILGVLLFLVYLASFSLLGFIVTSFGA